MITIGRLTLHESDNHIFEEESSDDGRAVTLSGIMHSPETNYLRMQSFHDDVLNLQSRLVPVLFDRKADRKGYYSVLASKSRMVHLPDQQFIQVTWEVQLQRLGADNELDLESRLSGPARLNNYSLAGERWHSPPGGHRAYWSGSGQPAQVIRTGGNGPIVAYRALAAGVNPRWQCDVEDYGRGRARFLDGQGVERCGTNFAFDPLVWELHNSLVSVKAGGAHTFDILVHDGTSWSTKDFNVTVNGAALLNPITGVLLHNEYDRVTLRLLFNQTPSGRYTVDFTVRRGARLVEIVVQSLLSSMLGVTRATNEAGTAGAGFVRATSDDASGDRYVIGSPKTFTNDLTAGGISIAATPRLYAFVGAEVGGSGAVAGDQAADIVNQYISALAEEVVGVNL